MKRIAIYILFATLPLLLTAQDSTFVEQNINLQTYIPNIADGDSAYAKGDYTTAISIYETILEKDGEAATL